MMLRDATELRQPLAKEAVAVLAGSCPRRLLADPYRRETPLVRRSDGRVSALAVCLIRRFRAPFRESALARTRIVVFYSFLTSCDVHLVSFAHVREFTLVDITAHVLNVVNEIEDGFVVSIAVTSGLSGRLRSHPLDDVEHLFEAKAMLTEKRVREVVKISFAGLIPVLLSVLTGRSSVDNRVTLAVDTRHRLAEPGETEPPEASLTRWKEDLS